MDLNGINTQNNAAAIRATIYSGVLRTQLEPELMAMKYVDVIQNFPDGDKWQDVEIGNATVHDYDEGSDVTFDGLAIGTRDFEINRYLYSGHFITEKFSQDAYLAAQIAAKIPAIESRAIMAKLEKTIYGNFDDILKKIENGILNGSVSASLEDTSDFYDGDARCSVRVFERFSHAGGNRVSLNVTLFQNGNGDIKLSAITSGGSQAMFFKINTWGEEAFLDKLREIL